MNNNNQKRGLYIILLGLIILLLVMYFAFFRKGPDVPVIIDQEPVSIIDDEPEDGLTTPSDIPRGSWQPNLQAEADHVFNESDLAKRARAFAERFGSYSNQSDYGNFRDLELFMTNSFATWSRNYVEQLRENSPSHESYYGISTRAITTDLISYDESAGKAEINITTERSESSEVGGALEPYYQDILLRLEKVGKDWLIDAAYWEKR